MNSMAFKSELLEQLRAFEKWAWRDSLENPSDYEDMVFDEWMDMFNTYMGDNR